MLKMGNADQEYIKRHLSRLPPGDRVESCRKIICHQLNRMNEVDSRDLERYVEIVVGNLTPEQLSALEKSPLAYTHKIQGKIETLLEEHAARQFDLWLETGRIICRESFRLPPSIHPARSTGTIGKSLYTAEEDMDGLELDVVMELTALPNVKWWHRNIARREFAINGYINHYPDIMIMTERCHLVFAEVKGEHLKNDDSRQKVKLGRAWQNAAGSRYRYYMVFRDTDTWVDGAVSMSEFLRILENL